LSEGQWQFRERGTIAQCAWFALDNGQIMSPVIDRARQSLVWAINEAWMFTQNLAFSGVMPKACLQHDDKTVRINPQTDLPFAKDAGTL
jgi:hypothetical protein